MWYSSPGGLPPVLMHYVRCPYSRGADIISNSCATGWLLISNNPATTFPKVTFISTLNPILVLLYLFYQDMQLYKIKEQFVSFHFLICMLRCILRVLNEMTLLSFYIRSWITNTIITINYLNIPKIYAFTWPILSKTRTGKINPGDLLTQTPVSSLGRLNVLRFK